MDLGIKNQWFIVGGATSGFGRATAEKLIEEGANVLAIARNEAELLKFQALHPEKIKTLAGDLSLPYTLDLLRDTLDLSSFSGAFINAGGPPSKRVMETRIEDWDDAYKLLLRWKVMLAQILIPIFTKNNYGKLVFVESVSVKQAIENLVLSNSLRMAVVGFVKTLALETAGKGITMNVLAPGYHDTNAIQRILVKTSELKGIGIEEARQNLINQIPAGKLGSQDDFASLASWLLSPHSNYINGQTISIDGGVVRGSFG